MVVNNIIIPIYGGRVHIIISHDFEKDLETLSKKYDRSLFGEHYKYVGLLHIEKIII